MNADETKFDATICIPSLRNIFIVKPVITSLTTWRDGLFTFQQTPCLHQMIQADQVSSKISCKISKFLPKCFTF